MGQHIRRDLSFYDGNSNRKFFARTVDSVGLSVKAIAGQISALFGVYDVNDNLISGFQSDGDLFAPNVISRFGEVDEFDLNSFYDREQFGVESSWTLDEANDKVIIQTEYSNGDIKYASLNFTDDPNAVPIASVVSELKTYSEVISALKLVNATNDTDVQIGDPATTFEDSVILGIALQAGIIGQQRQVQLFGKVEDLSFNYPINDSLFLGLDGSITNVAPTTGAGYTHSVYVGYSLGTGAIFLNIQEPIVL